MSRARAGETGHARAHPRGPAEGHAAAPRGARHQLGFAPRRAATGSAARRRPVGRVPQSRGGASRDGSVVGGRADGSLSADGGPGGCVARAAPLQRDQSPVPRARARGHRHEVRRRKHSSPGVEGRGARLLRLRRSRRSTVRRRRPPRTKRGLRSRDRVADRGLRSACARRTAPGVRETIRQERRAHSLRWHLDRPASLARARRVGRVDRRRRDVRQSCPIHRRGPRLLRSRAGGALHPRVLPCDGGVGLASPAVASRRRADRAVTRPRSAGRASARRSMASDVGHRGSGQPRVAGARTERDFGTGRLGGSVQTVASRPSVAGPTHRRGRRSGHARGPGDGARGSRC